MRCIRARRENVASDILFYVIGNCSCRSSLELKKPAIRRAYKEDGGVLEEVNIKTFFANLIVEFIIFIEKEIHIQKIFIWHISDVFRSHSLGWILNVFLTQFLCTIFQECVLRFLLLYYHRRRNVMFKTLMEIGNGDFWP